MTASWDTATCSLLEVDRLSEASAASIIKGRKTTWHYNPKSCNVYNNKLDLKELRLESVKWIHLTQDGIL